MILCFYTLLSNAARSFAAIKSNIPCFKFSPDFALAYVQKLYTDFLAAQQSADQVLAGSLQFLAFGVFLY